MRTSTIVLAALLLAATTASAQFHQIAFPEEPLAALSTPGEARSIRSFNSVTLSDPPGDFYSTGQILTTALEPPPSGGSYTMVVPKWFVSGGLVFPARPFVEIVFPRAGYSYCAIYKVDSNGQWSNHWNGESIEFADGEQTTLHEHDDSPVHVSRAVIEDLGSNWRVTVEVTPALPASDVEYAINWGIADSDGGPINYAIAWNSPGFGIYRYYGFASDLSAVSRNWLDFVSTTARQSDGETLTLEAVVNEPFPADPADGGLSAAVLLAGLTDGSGVVTDRIVTTFSSMGWSSYLGSYDRRNPANFTVVEHLPPPRIEGNRIIVNVPVRSLGLRDRVRVGWSSRALIQTEGGEVTITRDGAGPLDLTLSDPPEIVVSALPGALVQPPDVGGATTTFTLTNVGDAPTTVTLEREDDFFTLAPGVFELAGGSSQVVTVTGVPKPPGGYGGSVTATGLGVPEGLAVGLTMLVTAPPSGGEAAAKADANRVDVAAPAEQDRVEASVGFTNVGTAPLTGLVVADVPWLEIAEPLLTIGAGERAVIPFAIDRTKRTDADERLGSTVGNLSLQYLAGSGAGAAAALLEALAGGVQVSTTLVTVTDTAKPRTRVGAPRELYTGELALFVPSLGHVQSPAGTFISDLYLSTLVSQSDLAIYYTPAGMPLETTLSAAIAALSASRPIAFADLTRTVFDQENGLGTIQVRGETSLAKLASVTISASVFNKSNAAGTYGSAVPVFRSDRGIAAGEAFFIPGLLPSSARSRTNLTVQEVRGKDAPIRVEVYDEAGALLATREDLVPAFQHVRMNDFAPPGAATAVIRLREGAEGSVLAYATPLDVLSGDTWVVTDWPRVDGFDPAGRQIIPIAGKLEGGNQNYFRSSVAIVNQAAAPASVIVRFVPDLGEPVERTVAVPGGGSVVWADAIDQLFDLERGLGYLEIDPQGTPVTVTSRTFATIGEDPRTFGTGVPAVAAASMSVGDAARISGFDDADQAVVTAKTPATFRTNLGLVETSGKSTTVRVTIHFRHPVSTTVTAVGSATKEWTLAPRQFVLLQGIAAQVLGEYRSTLKGNLKDLFVDIEVVSGEGEVIAFTSSVDNGTGDQLFKLQ